MTAWWKGKILVKYSASERKSLSNTTTSTCSSVTKMWKIVVRLASRGTSSQDHKTAQRTPCFSLIIWVRLSRLIINITSASKPTCTAKWIRAWTMACSVRQVSKLHSRQTRVRAFPEMMVICELTDLILASSHSTQCTKNRARSMKMRFCWTLALESLKNRRTSFTWTSSSSTQSCSLTRRKTVAFHPNPRTNRN